MDYNATLNLPKTEFPMRAGLPAREPGMLENWYKLDLYHEMLKRNEGKPSFILHDGPPFSNGHLHMGHALNKSIKDFIVRYKSMAGYKAPFTPGWDNHGMPIESAIIKQQKLNRKAMTIPEFRTACHEFAQNFVNIQRDEFKRLGFVGDWDLPYLTMEPKFEAEEVKVFGKMYEKGYIYKGKKPVYWCPSDETALAEAEIEYKDDKVTTIFVKFRVTDDKGLLGGIDLSNTYFVIWTTTTWTIPGNLAICLNPGLEYCVVEASNGENYIMAQELCDSVLKKAGLERVKTLAAFKGAEMELMTARHPLFERDSLVILGEHVTLDAGTGCVHTAPAYGADDYNVCRKYPQIPSGRDLVVNVDDNGRFNAAAGKYEGLKVLEAHAPIFADLVAANAILASEDIVHSYPHCWRCKNPIIFRATDQWFCSVDAFKNEAVAAAESVKWLPEWGCERISGMIRERADWCISRQRHWGLPIPVFYCEDCGKPVCTTETINKISEIFRAEGSNAWFIKEASELLPEGFACPHCGGKTFTKETDTLDGWFDSGSTHIASMELDAPGCWPADLYMEGGDQYRGWFQSSLLTAVAVKGKAPYRTVLTHGWTVDGEGKQMHKSLGNGVAPEDVIKKYGADLVRLWAASADYRQDMRVSENILKQLSDKYLKIRNTARYILGNLDGFDPNAALGYDEMLPLDKWALGAVEELRAKCIAAYDKYEFHAVSYAIHNFCVVEMSSFYLDVIKDRLYCDGKDSVSRRSAQTAIWTILDEMVRLVAPILAFTADEIWLAMPHKAGDDVRNVALNDMPAAHPEWVLSDEDKEKWGFALTLRGEALKALEEKRADKTIGKPLDAEIEVTLTEDEKSKLDTYNLDLAELFIVSRVDVSVGEHGVNAEPCDNEKCPRCWRRDRSVGEVKAHPELCRRCAEVVYPD
ncbi:MAG: isoleucine--tRNA ligase [Oscillospiraceae bacterium]|nr:isoleucine--tRNA ligase [Oscillospiraceae bacterium]